MENAPVDVVGIEANEVVKAVEVAVLEDGAPWTGVLSSDTIETAQGHHARDVVKDHIRSGRCFVESVHD